MSKTASATITPPADSFVTRGTPRVRPVPEVTTDPNESVQVDAPVGRSRRPGPDGRSRRRRRRLVLHGTRPFRCFPAGLNRRPNAPDPAVGGPVAPSTPPRATADARRSSRGSSAPPVPLATRFGHDGPRRPSAPPAPLGGPRDQVRPRGSRLPPDWPGAGIPPGTKRGAAPLVGVLVRHADGSEMSCSAQKSISSRSDRKRGGWPGMARPVDSAHVVMSVRARWSSFAAVVCCVESSVAVRWTARGSPSPGAGHLA